MRVTTFMIYNQLTRSMQRVLEDYSSLNEMLGTTKKINKPSDDVIGMNRVIDYRLTINGNNQYTKNADSANANIKFTGTVMTSVSNTVTELKSLLNTGLRDINDDVARTTDQQHAVQLRDMLLDLSNNQYGDRYIFSGFKTDTKPYDQATYAYNGDSGIMNVMIDKGTTVPVNVPGSTAFSYTLSAPQVVQSDGNFIHYTPGAGTTVDVEIRASDDSTVLDTFSFSNVIQMADIMQSALNNKDTMRLNALTDPFNRMSQQVMSVVTDNSLRSVQISDQQTQIQNITNDFKAMLSKTEDADMTEVITMINKTQVSLQALQQSSARIISKSLMDFLA